MTYLFLIPACLCFSCASAPTPVRLARIEWVGEYRAGEKDATEIVSVQSTTQRAALANCGSGTVEILDLTTPAQPARSARFELALASGEQLTSVAFHPKEDYFAACIQGAGIRAQGRLELRAAKGGALLARLPLGIGPDCVVIDPTGAFAVVANEAEGFEFDRVSRRFTSPSGSVSIVRLDGGPKQASVRTLELPSLAEVRGGARAEDGRLLEREVDWNANGEHDPELDFDGNGATGKGSVVVGTFEGVPLRGSEAGGETFLFPCDSKHPSLIEPEAVALSPDGRLAFVSLQEINTACVLDVAQARLVRSFGLGTTTHPADVKKDGQASFDGTLVALREPDGIALSPDGRYLFTADEGDTDPKVSELAAGKPAGGGRTVSIFDAATGELLGDTGCGIDEAAAAAGAYPDGRSEAKGCEPEMVVAFELDGVLHAAASLERAGGVALIDASDPRHPRVISVALCHSGGKAGEYAPEGLAYLRHPATGEHFLVTANEGNGSVSVFKLGRGESLR